MDSTFVRRCGIWSPQTNKHKHKKSENSIPAPTRTIKDYIKVIKWQIYVQMKEKIATDPFQTHTSSKSPPWRNPLELSQTEKSEVTATYLLFIVMLSMSFFFFIQRLSNNSPKEEAHGSQ